MKTCYVVEPKFTKHDELLPKKIDAGDGANEKKLRKKRGKIVGKIMHVYEKINW